MVSSSVDIGASRNTFFIRVGDGGPFERAYDDGGAPIRLENTDDVDDRGGSIEGSSVGIVATCPTASGEGTFSGKAPGRCVPAWETGRRHCPKSLLRGGVSTGAGVRIGGGWGSAGDGSSKKSLAVGRTGRRDGVSFSFAGMVVGSDDGTTIGGVLPINVPSSSKLTISMSSPGFTLSEVTSGAGPGMCDVGCAALLRQESA